MKYIELVRNGNTNLAIVQELTDKGIKVLGFNDNTVTCKDMCLPVEVSWEMCMCHGGRVWVSQKQTNIHIELSSPEYDTDKGIVDPETELAWRIENELVDTVKSFSSYVYVVVETGKYLDNEVNYHYFNSSEKASEYLFGQKGYDVNVQYGTVTYQPPNPDMKTEYKYVNDDNGRITFEATEYHRKCESDPFKPGRTWTVQYFVYRKKN